MARIAALEEHVIRQIAAGEVVERPASVVKELVENAIDAGAKRVSLETEGSGREMIRIADDGCGMNPEDAELALQRHTTSKIRVTADLETLHTFGFRGEALPSIAAVSRLELITRSDDNPVGISLSLEGGKITEKKECGRSVGTTFTVRDLFFNQPARLKFMKADSTERAKILQTFEEIAFAHPHIHLEYKTKNLDLPVRRQFIDRVTDIWGKNFTGETLFPISLQHPFVKIDGWVSKPESHLSSRNYQIFYVNQRPIQSRLISHALYEAFRDCLPVGRHPAGLIFLSLDPSQVDVNVHPSKREVRFRNEHQIYEALVKEIRAKRSQFSGPPRVFAAGSPAGVTVQPMNPAAGNYPFQRGGAPQPASLFPAQSAPHFANAPGLFGGTAHAYRPETRSGAQLGTQADPQGHAASGSAPSTLAINDAPRVLCQFSALYVLAEHNDSLLIVDQHAAAERVLYERFRAALATRKKPAAQPLLIPLLWNVSLSQAEALKGHLETFRALGFAIEPFGETTFRVTETPSLVEQSRLLEALDGALAALENRNDPLLSSEDAIAHAACRAAIKANDRLSPRELSELLRQLSECENPHTCPHGRPVALTYTRAELDKKFGRT